MAGSMQAVASYGDYKIIKHEGKYIAATARAPLYDFKYCICRREAELQIRHHRKYGRWF